MASIESSADGGYSHPIMKLRSSKIFVWDFVSTFVWRFLWKGYFVDLCIDEKCFDEREIVKIIVCVEIKILEVIQRIEVFKEDNLVEVVGLFCKKHGLTVDT